MLYRTYRPKKWAEVVGQEHVVRTLQGALALGRVGHAYLFAGPRGTGKTTLARIFAKALNCDAKKEKPCGSCDFCVAVQEGRSLDLIEIDAASNRTIDDMRQLKETVGVAATGGKYKVYLVDEAHMITREAFNAFLKLLEEPPAHVVFILATTEAHKILPTVLSRVQRFDFKRLQPAEIMTKLAHIVKAEKITAEPEALAMLAGAADGALRDAEVMLTKMASQGGGITAASVQTVLGLVPITWHGALISAIASGDRIGALRLFSDIIGQGADPDQLARGLLEYLRAVMIAKIDASLITDARMALAQPQMDQLIQLGQGMDGALLVRAIQAFTQARVQLKISPVPLLPLELAVLELTESKK